MAWADDSPIKIGYDLRYQIRRYYAENIKHDESLKTPKARKQALLKQLMEDLKNEVDDFIDFNDQWEEGQK